MPEENSSPSKWKRIQHRFECVSQDTLERGGQEMQDIFEFHEQKHPGRFVSNHIDFLLAVTAGKVNRYLVVPLVAYHGIRDGIAEHRHEAYITGTMEAIFFILFSTYFARIKSFDLLRVLNDQGVKKMTKQMGLGYAKGRVISYFYLYKIASIFINTHPNVCYRVTKYSLMAQNILRGVL